MSTEHQTVCLVGGSFDPVTRGHEQLIRTGARMFDEMHVVIGVNPKKNCLLTGAERKELMQIVVDDMGITDVPIHVHSLQGRLLAHLATDLGVTHLLRGVRDSVDFAYEEKASGFNRKINPGIQTVYITLPGFEDVSSSAVKEVFGLEGWEHIVAPDVHPRVLEALTRKHLAQFRLAA